MNLTNWLADFQLDENLLVGPFFYKTPLALRFEIGPEVDAIYLPEEAYLEKAYGRAVRLLETASSTYDYLIFSQFPHEDWDLDANLADFMARFGFAQAPQPEFLEVTDLIGDVYTWRRYLFPLTTQDLKPIVREIVRVDFAGLPYLSASVTFLSSRDQVLYHCYDDRGVDIAAVSNQTRRALFTFCHDLLFDYDMEEMKRRMEGSDD